MIALIQRVNYGKVKINGSIKSEINNGLILYIGIDRKDTEKDIDYILNKVLNLRIFSDKLDKFNFSIKDLGQEILIVSNFTLNAKTRVGNRPDFSNAKNPNDAKDFYKLFLSKMKSVFDKIQTGEFGENMEVESNNDGPVNIIIDSQDQFKPRNSF
tara:strand:+ start:2206 stop:2673 length:468 start_codon:yes stop_codon:yes gene_type:complete